MGLCSNGQSCGAIVALLVFASLFWLFGSSLSAIWCYSARRGLNAGEQGQYRTLLVLKFVLILFAFDILNAFIGNILLSLRITDIITGHFNAVSIAFETALITAPAITLSVIGIYRLQASRDVTGLSFDAGLGVGTITSLSLATGICSGFLRSAHEKYAFIIPAVMILLSILGNGVCSYLTHQNIIERFPTERNLSFRRLAISVGIQSLLSIPFIVTSFGSLYGREFIQNLEIVDITMTASRISSITNGFIYGWTNRRVLPHFRKAVGINDTQQVPASTLKTPVPSISGRVNLAFEDNTL